MLKSIIESLCFKMTTKLLIFMCKSDNSILFHSYYFDIKNLEKDALHSYFWVWSQLSPLGSPGKYTLKIHPADKAWNSRILKMILDSVSEDLLHVLIHDFLIWISNERSLRSEIYQLPILFWLEYLYVFIHLICRKCGCTLVTRGIYKEIYI